MANDTRLTIIMCLINNAEEMTAAEISKDLDMPHQLVRYHLPQLLDAALILKNRSRYFCQPVLIDPDVMQELLEANSDPVLSILSKVYLDFDNVEDKKKGFKNLLSLLMQMMVDNMDTLFE